MRNALYEVSKVASLRRVWTARQQRLLYSCAGVDRVTGFKFKANLNANLDALSSNIRSSYSPIGLLAIVKPKESGGERVICVPTVADRLVQFALLEQIRPRLKRTGLDNGVSFGLAPGKARSLIGARDFACRARRERPWVYKTDIQKFFDTIDRSVLRSRLNRCLPQRSLRKIVASFLHTEIADGFASDWRKAVARAGIQPGRGVRQGMPLSPFFAGVYLRDLDAWLIREGYLAARYVDDVVAFFDSEPEAHRFHARLKSRVEPLGLAIGDINASGSKTKVYRPDEPAASLGMEIKKVGDSYCLYVSEQVKKKIGDRFAELSVVETLLNKGVVLTTLGTFVSNMQCGYRNAYDAAHNFDDFKLYLDQLGSSLKQLVVHQLLGPQLEKLSEAEINFLGIRQIILPEGE